MIRAETAPSDVVRTSTISVIRDGVDIGTLINQELHSVNVTTSNGLVKWLPSVPVRLVQRFIVIRSQIIERINISMSSGNVTLWPGIYGGGRRRVLLSESGK